MARQLTLEQFEQRVSRADNRMLKNLQKNLQVLSLKAERQAKLNATDYPRVRTGRLRSSITGLVDAKNGSPRVLLRAGGNTSGAPVNYANYVEFGTKHMRPRLFMARALKKVLKEDTPKELRNLLKISLNEGK
jgi:HK97 gp10 family phage protein